MSAFLFARGGDHGAPPLGMNLMEKSLLTTAQQIAHAAITFGQRRMGTHVPGWGCGCSWDA
jgi:hypothetical protein